MKRTRILTQLGVLLLSSVAFPGCFIGGGGFYCILAAIFSGHPELCSLEIPPHPDVSCSSHPDPGTGYVVPIGLDIDLSNPCESAPGVPSLGNFLPGDWFTFDNPLQTDFLLITARPAGEVPSFKLHASGPIINLLVPYTYSNASGNIGHGTLFVKTPSSGAGADLAVTITAFPDPVAKNDLLTYITTVTNNGPSSATGVVLTDTLLPRVLEIESVAVSQGSCVQTKVFDNLVETCTLGTLARGASATLFMSGFPFVSGRVTKTSTVVAVEPDGNLANNAATETTTVQ
jgi:uncharacterized repeat protein (TIGR01451 family)